MKALPVNYLDVANVLEVRSFATRVATAGHKVVREIAHWSIIEAQTAHACRRDIEAGTRAPVGDAAGALLALGKEH